MCCSINGAPCTKARRCSRSARLRPRLRAAGKRVIILSNSGRRSDDNAERLADLGLPAKEHDGILTSGEVVWHGLHERSARALRPARPARLPDRQGQRPRDDRRARFRRRHQSGARRFHLAGWARRCQHRPGGLARGAGNIRRARPADAVRQSRPDDVHLDAACCRRPARLARLYAQLGGTVHYVGKPHPAIFAAALRELGNAGRSGCWWSAIPSTTTSKAAGAPAC